MSDQKFTIKDFMQRLADGHYAARVGALRAAGRAKGWSDRERIKAQEAATAHFDTPGAAKKKDKKPAKADKAKPAKSTKTKAEPKVAARRGRPPGSKNKKTEEAAPKQAAKRTKRVSPVEDCASEFLIQADPFAEAGAIIKHTHSAMLTQQGWKALGAPDEAVKANAELATQRLAEALDQLVMSTRPAHGEHDRSVADFAKVAVATAKANGQVAQEEYVDLVQEGSVG